MPAPNKLSRTRKYAWSSLSLILLLLHTGFALQLDPSVKSRQPLKSPPILQPTPTATDRRDLLKIAGKNLLTGTLLGFYSKNANALTPEQAASDYDTYAATYDDLDGGEASSLLGIDEARAKLFAQASGKVLEIGAGTGLNLNRYNPSQLTSLTLLDISDGMLSEAQRRLEAIRRRSAAWRDVPVRFVKADATSELVQVFGARSFDTVVDSFSLCVMGNEGAKACLVQISQVVQTESNNGQVLLLENSRSSNPLLGLYQDATAEAAASAGGKGCVYNQNVGGLISSTKGLIVKEEEAFAAGLFRSFRCIAI